MVKRKDLIKELGDIMEKEAKEKLVEKVENYSKDKKMVSLYSKYTRQELEKNTLIHEAEERGLKEGIKEGLQGKSIEIAKKMLEENIEIDFIIRMTGLTKEEIESL